MECLGAGGDADQVAREDEADIAIAKERVREISPEKPWPGWFRAMRCGCVCSNGRPAGASSAGFRYVTVDA